MVKFTRLLFVAILLWITMSAGLAQAKEEKPATASITGRITANDQPLSGVTVALVIADPIQYNQQGPQRQISAKTDSNGRYRLVGIAAGQYLVSPRALAYVLPSDGMTGRVGKNVNIGEGEQIEAMDFALSKGGVITGKITDYLDRPVIAQRVNLRQFTRGTQTISVSDAGNFYMFETDDRGRYRLFGLPAGRYLVSAGTGRSGGTTSGYTGKYYLQTFYPGVASEAEAKVIEVTEGSESTDIDIKLPKAEKAYSARGRIVDASTGAPIAGAQLAYGAVNPQLNRLTSMGGIGMGTNAQGEFTLQGLGRGSYAAFFVGPDSEYYSDPVTFEILDSDTEGLEIKATRGSSLSGVIVIEGTNDPAVLKLVTEVRVNAFPATPSSQSLQVPMITSGRSTTNPDGSFRVGGLRVGKNRINASVMGRTPLMVTRMERDGVEIQEIEISAGEQVTGIKIVMAFGSGIIRGQLNIVGGTLPPGAQFVVSAMRAGSVARTSGRPTPVDSRGKFVIEGLAPGEYEVRLFPLGGRGGEPIVQPPRPLIQKVTVGAGETPVTLTLDLSEKKERQQ